MRRFSGFNEAAAENARSRIYLGIHWQFDADAGVAQGSLIADEVFASLAAPRFVARSPRIIWCPPQCLRIRHARSARAARARVPEKPAAAAGAGSATRRGADSYSAREESWHRSAQTARHTRND